MRKTGGLLFAVMAILSQSALSLAQEKKFYVGAGTTFENLSSTAGAAGGASTFIPNTLVHLGVSYRMRAFDSIFFIPTLKFTPFGVSDSDSATTKRHLGIGLMFGLPILPGLGFRAGPGVLFVMHNGSGGTTTLSNGTGSSTFALPSSSRSSRLIYLAAGIGVLVDQYRFDIDAVVTSTFSDSRAVNVEATFSYALF